MDFPCDLDPSDIIDIFVLRARCFAPPAPWQNEMGLDAAIRMVSKVMTLDLGVPVAVGTFNQEGSPQPKSLDVRILL